ncbi:GNAT family N-acetyltransferase [Photobacterium galatheae]|nr:GNAT family N-acetyltransferase [Photobacterium galatheae]
MNTTVVYVENENMSHRSQFEVLFHEYASQLSAEIKNTIVSQLFTLPYFHGFMCFVDNKPAGFAVCFESFSSYRAKKVLNIHDFMVSEDSRGQGVGKVLLQGIEQYCCDNDYVKMTLEVDDANVAAKKLYSSCGYEDYQVALKGQLHWQKYLL